MKKVISSQAAIFVLNLVKWVILKRVATPTHPHLHPSTPHSPKIFFKLAQLLKLDLEMQKFPFLRRQSMFKLIDARIKNPINNM